MGGTAIRAGIMCCLVYVLFFLYPAHIMNRWERFGHAGYVFTGVDENNTAYNVSCYEGLDHKGPRHILQQISSRFSNLQYTGAVALDTRNVLRCNIFPQSTHYSHTEISHGAVFIGGAFALQSVEHEDSFYSVLEKSANGNGGRAIALVGSDESIEAGFSRFMEVIPNRPKSIVYVWTPMSVPHPWRGKTLPCTKTTSCTWRTPTGTTAAPFSRWAP